MGNVTVSANGLTLVHVGSKGKAMATIPDVCKTPFPSPPGPLPLPYPNIAESKKVKNGSVLTKIDGESTALLGSSVEQSQGDEAGSLGGIVSGSNKDEAFFIKWSPDVSIECRPVCRKTDMMIMNKINTISMSGMDQSDIEGQELTDETGTLEFEIIDEDGKPIPEVNYIIKMQDGSEISGEVDDQGKAKVEDVPLKSYKIIFPELDEETEVMKLK
ncbi:MAG: DUF4150 domain-containing protein [Proteobacteria bacterium]|nr:DUF4150 domain-containing protein [Pseudomonadota bacterium]